MKLFRHFVLVFFVVVAGAIHSAAQVTVTPQPSSDTTEPVEILPGVRKLEVRKLPDGTQLQILAGNVKLRQGNTLFSCDSCVLNNTLKVFEAFGNVHINDADTSNIYSDHLRYLMDKKIAYFNRNVRLTDGKGTLTTQELEYDVNTKIGIYRKGGKVVNKNTVLTSGEGYYYTDIKDIYFKHNVELKDPTYYVKTDSLLYNTETETARFIAQTFIEDSSGRTIVTNTGFYDLKYGIAEFGGRPIIKDGKITIIANEVFTNDSTGMSIARGNAIIVDTAQGMTIIGGEIIRNNKTESFLASRKPLMIIEQDNDSIYIAADTLFSARLTDLYSKDSVLIMDTVQGTRFVKIEEGDSTNRYFEAFRNVRIFSDSLQAVSDSAFYSFRDSVFRLYDDPVVWSNENQITGDTIHLFTRNKQAERIEVYENSFLVSEIDPGVYNQVKATRMDGFFVDGNIDSVRARGLARSIYYVQDEDSAYTGINETESDVLDIYFENRELTKVVFRSAVKGTLWPMSQKTPEEMRLESFRWLDNRRPKTKFELFE